MSKILYILRKVKAMNKKKATTNKKCSVKCCTCEFYTKNTDFCKAKQIENCTKQPNTDFSQCEEYLVNQKLVMF